MSHPTALSINNVTKTFQTRGREPVKAVQQVSFQIEEGKIYGLLGPNGAGKSTLISMMSGVLLPDAGTIKLFDIDIVKQSEKAKQMVGIVPQEVVVEAAFTVEEVLYYFGGMYGVPVSKRTQRIDEILEDLQLSDKKKERARSLSGGMKRRLMIAKAIMHNPRFLILDEPTAGVDVMLRKKIWDLVRKLNKQGTTILFTTHYLEEAEELCEAISVIDKGKVIKQGNLADIQREFSQNIIYFELFDQDMPHLEGVRRVGMEYEYPMKDLKADFQEILKHYGKNIKSIRNEAASLEKIFLELTQ